VFARTVSPLLQAESDPAAAHDVTRDGVERLGASVTIIDSDETFLGGSHDNRQQMNNHLLRLRCSPH
jgi:hypothetical protein